MSRFVVYSGAVALMLAGAMAAGTDAAVTVAVDADPATAGIQSTLDVALGGSFTVDVVALGVIGLEAYEFDLGFNPAVLSALSASDGGFLNQPLTELANDLTAPDVSFGQLSQVGPVSGDGVLASVTFQAVGPGVSPLQLSNVDLGAGEGGPIAVDSAQNASATAVIPEPVSWLIWGMLGACLLGARRAIE